jgi:hypothetical protein
MSFHTFWIRFQNDGNLPPAAAGGCGVTARSIDDALRLIRERIFAGEKLPDLVELVEDVDIATLHPDDVLPNMSPPNWEGIWFPRGFGDVDEIWD